ALLVLGALGAVATALDRRRPGDRALALVLGAWWLSLLAAAFTSRYRVPALPLLAALGARGLVAVAEFARTRDRKKLGASVGAAALLALFLLLVTARRVPPDPRNALRTRGLAALSL